ncbi:winged helix-turn-helix transcriptional regulator [Pyxidicoccus trucidator]|uniref:winged helix-turn-helix transcriptional regulator n=1 Tax=Pyxidicoccus trucidator TaxID=2709662 RepID=UPI0013DD65A2|nr:helix-turn-helix domain-containing protein [Pyxidicoccus trucidator]
MAKRDYGQFCGLVRALEIVGERWALVIVRDLLVSPRRFTDLRQGLPRIPSNILSARLKELEEAGIVQRRLLPRPVGSVVYELTAYGHELEDVVLRLGRWGAKSLTEPGPEDIVTVDSLIMAMRSTFRPEGAHGLDVGYELRVGEAVLHMRIDGGVLKVAQGPLPGADLVIETGPAIKALMTGELSPADAIASGSVKLKGKGGAKLLARFAETFRI